MLHRFARPAALIAGLWLTAAPASAATVLTTTVSVSPAPAYADATASATAFGGTGEGSRNVAFSSVELPSFDTANGILMGATVSVQAATVGHVSVTIPSPAGAANAFGFVSVSATVEAPGVSLALDAASLEVSCFAEECAAGAALDYAQLMAGPRSAAVAPLSALSYYAGPGGPALALARTGRIDIDVLTFGPNTATAIGGATLGVAGFDTYSIAYHYLNFAQASFDGVTEAPATFDIDLGTLILGQGLVTRAFSITNLGDDNSASLSLIAIQQLQNSGFNHSLAGFENLAAGASSTAGFTFDPASLGHFGATYLLGFADYAPGGVGARLFSRNVHIHAEVVEAPPPSAVPEPRTWALLLIGSALAGLRLRRRRSAAAV